MAEPTAAPAAGLTAEQMAERTAGPMAGPMAERIVVHADPALIQPVAGGMAGRREHRRPALSRLTQLTGTTFADEHWGRRPLLVRRADAHGFADLLDLDGVDELLSRRGLRTPFLRLARAGVVADSSTFTGPGGVGAEVADQVVDHKVAALFAGGSSVVLQALHRNWPAVIDFTGALAGELGHPVQANAYITPPSSQGFTAHYDVHDVFVLQLAGTKEWTIHAPVHPDPLRDEPWNLHAAAVAARARDEEPVLETVLEPGDVMYLPRGWLHAATALGGVCAHLTIGVHVVTRFAVVQALLSLVAGDPQLRASLPLGLDVADPAQLEPSLAQVREALAKALDRVDADAVAQEVRRRVWDGNRPEPIRPIAGFGFAQGLSVGDRVRLRTGLGHRLVQHGDQVVLELAGRRVRFPVTVSDALHLLLGGPDVAVGQLPGMPDEDQVVLVRRLLGEGVLVPGSR